MSHSVLLIALPRNPVTFDALRPRHDAAALAAALRGLGARVRIGDPATLERLCHLIPSELLPHIAESPKSLTIDYSHRLLTPFYLGAVARAARQYLADQPADVVAFLTRSPFELRCAATIAERLDLPGACAVSDHRVHELNACPPEMGNLLLEALRRPAHTIDGFDPDVYPALREETKLRVFEIGADTPVADSISGVFTILEETAALNRHYNTRAFHFGRSVAGNQFYHLASELVSRKSRFRYSVTAAMADYPAELAAVAAASGCVAAGFLIGSGSQRLLDEHYILDFKLHAAEHTIRAFAEAGMHTRVDLAYPCVRDDFHTRDETLRFVARCLPHSVWVDTPADAGNAASSAFWKPAERRRRNLERAIQKLGVAAGTHPTDALIATLAGFAGRERQFRSHAARALVTGHFDDLGTLVETINNSAAAGRSDTLYWKSFGADQRMVGN